jgi:hypothetical protein
MKKHNPFRYFKTSPEIIRLGVMMYVRFPLMRRGILSRGGKTPNETAQGC